MTSKEQLIRQGVDAALAGIDDYIGRDWGDILCFAKTLAVEVRRLRAQVETTDRCLAAGCEKPTLRAAFCEKHNAKVPTDELPDQLLDVNAICDQRDLYLELLVRASVLIEDVPVNGRSKRYVEWCDARDAWVADRIAGKRVPEKAAAFECPTCPRCDVDHWPHCPEKTFCDHTFAKHAGLTACPDCGVDMPASPRTANACRCEYGTFYDDCPQHGTGRGQEKPA